MAKFYHYNIHSYDKAKKYYLIGANLNCDICKEELNRMLEQNFDFKFAIKAYHKLNESNLNKLNGIICEYEKIRNTSNEITCQMECVNCYENKQTIFLFCGHPTCANCYGTKCRLCGSN